MATSIDFEKHRSILQAYDNDVYLHIAIFCTCGTTYYTQWHDALAKHEMKYGGPPVQVCPTSKVEQRCCPEIATPEGIVFYGVNTEHALTYSDPQNDPILLTTFTCDGCGKKHPILLDGRHRLYRAVVEGMESMPVFVLPESGFKHFSYVVRMEA